MSNCCLLKKYQEKKKDNDGTFYNAKNGLQDFVDLKAFYGFFPRLYLVHSSRRRYGKWKKMGVKFWKQEWKIKAKISIERMREIKISNVMNVASRGTVWIVPQK